MLSSQQHSGSLSRNADFWFSDGSIVVIVEDTAFRIHKSVLSKHSEVFANLFTIPQPDDLNEVVEGCPTVRLVNDDLSDFTDLVKALYEPLCVFFLIPYTITRF